jgi:4-amino-4-deoxy-L-arabinose transferase-like glycosyltransferase
MKHMSESRARILLVAVIALAAFLRLWQTDQLSIFGDYDEYYTAKTASGIYESKLQGGPFFNLHELSSDSFTEKIRDANRDNGNSVLYNFVLSFSTAPFGHSDFSMRCFSTFFDLLSIVFIWLIGKKLNVRIERILLACVLFAVYPVMVNYAGIVRTYAFTTFLCVLFFYLLLHLTNEKWSFKKSLAIGITGTAIFLGHFLTYYILVVAFLYFLFRLKSDRNRSVTALAGLGITALLCGAFLLYNLKNISNFNDNSKRIEQLAGKSVEEGNRRKLEPVSLATLVPKTTMYFDQFYTGNTYAMKWIQAIFGDKLMYVSGGIFLLIPAVLLFSIKKNKDQRHWIKLWAWIIIAGHIGALGLVFLSGHMISLGIKYTMFSIPFYLMLIAFFARDSKLTQLAFVLLAGGSLFTCVGSFATKGNKAVKIVFDGEEKVYQSSDRDVFIAKIQNFLQENKDTVFVNTMPELVFIEMTGLRTTQQIGYVLELDPQSQCEEKTLPFHFQIPD